MSYPDEIYKGIPTSPFTPPVINWTGTISPTDQYTDWHAKFTEAEERNKLLEEELYELKPYTSEETEIIQQALARGLDMPTDPPRKREMLRLAEQYLKEWKEQVDAVSIWSKQEEEENEIYRFVEAYSSKDDSLFIILLDEENCCISTFLKSDDQTIEELWEDARRYLKKYKEFQPPKIYRADPNEIVKNLREGYEQSLRELDSIRGYVRHSGPRHIEEVLSAIWWELVTARIDLNRKSETIEDLTRLADKVKERLINEMIDAVKCSSADELAYSQFNTLELCLEVLGKFLKPSSSTEGLKEPVHEYRNIVAEVLSVPAVAKDELPEGYLWLQADVICKCPRVWNNGKGRYACCQGNRPSVEKGD